MTSCTWPICSPALSSILAEARVSFGISTFVSVTAFFISSALIWSLSADVVSVVLVLLGAAFDLDAVELVVFWFAATFVEPGDFSCWRLRSRVAAVSFFVGVFVAAWAVASGAPTSAKSAQLARIMVLVLIVCVSYYPPSQHLKGNAALERQVPVCERFQWLGLCG